MNRTPFLTAVSLAFFAGFNLPSLCDAQIFFARDDIMRAVGWKPGPPITHDISQRQSYADPRWRAKMLPH